MGALKIYRDTLTNLAITCESSAANCNSPTVYCTDGGTSYSQSCLLERDSADTSLWQCESGSSFDCFYSISPTINPTKSPTSDPSTSPTTDPTTQPSANPTGIPTEVPTNDPSKNPTASPTMEPTTVMPSTSPSDQSLPSSDKP